MSEINTIRVLNFTGKKDDWSTWSGKFLAKAKRSGTKDALLGRIDIPKTLDSIDEKAEEGKRLLKALELDELAFTELVLSIDVSSSAGKTAFSIIKSCKTKNYEDGNAALAWEKLRKEYEPASAPSLLKTERVFRESKLSKDEDPEVWITSLEDSLFQLEAMGSVMTDDQFMIQVLNSLTSDYELLVKLLRSGSGIRIIC